MVTIEQIIDTLGNVDRSLPVFVETILDNGATVRTSPGRIESWRGAYELPTLYPDGGTARTAGGFRAYLTKRVGGPMTGYKGGDYSVPGDRALWADDYGDCDYWSIVGTRVESDAVVLIRAQGATTW